MVKDLQDNAQYRLFRELIGESKAVTIASVALIVAALSLLMAWMAVHDSIHVKIQQQVVLESNLDLKKEIRLLQMKVDRYEAKLDQGDH